MSGVSSGDYGDKINTRLVDQAMRKNVLKQASYIRVLSNSSSEGGESNDSNPKKGLKQKP